KVTTIHGRVNEQESAIIIGANEAVLQDFTVIYPGTPNSRPAILCRDCGMKILNNILINYGGTNSGPAISCHQSSYLLSETSPPSQPYIANNFIRSFSTTLNCMDSANVVFKNNVIVNNNSGYQWGISLNFSNSEIRNNTFMLNGSNGSFINCIASNPIISSNIFYNQGDGLKGIDNLHNGQPKISYNDFFIGGVPYDNCEPGIGDIQADPLFMNIDRGDFRLSENSLCIDAGNPDPQFNDLDGSRNDMGAFGGPNPIDLSLLTKLFVSLATSSTSGFPADTAKISIEVDKAAGIAIAQFGLEFDGELLAPLFVKKSGLTENFSVRFEPQSQNKIDIWLGSQTEIQSGAGSIVDIFFFVNPAAQSEQTTPLTLYNAQLFDGAGEAIEIKGLTHGIFTVNYMGSSENIIYVDANNSGLEDGTRGFPFNTITEAVNYADNGDTIIVVAGNYREQLDVNKGVFLRGAGPKATIIEAGGEAEFVDYTVRIKTHKNCGINGFTIKNNSYGFISSILFLDAPLAVIENNKIVSDEIWPGSLITWNNSNGGVLQNNFLSDNCVEINNSENLLIKNNRFSSANLGVYSLSCNQSQVKILTNKFEVSGANTGIHLSNTSRGIIQNNVIESTAPGGKGIETRESSAEIFNNTIVTYETNIRALINSSLTVMNNILVGRRIDDGIYNLGDTESSYNNIWNHRYNYNGLSPGIGDISLNPLFADSTNSNFNLNPDSPCIDAGNPDAQFNDLDGSRNDMGAFGGPLADTTGFLSRHIEVNFAETTPRTGDTLIIPIHADDLKDIAQFELEIIYDNLQITILTVKRTQLTQPFILSMTQPSAGITHVNFSSQKPIDQKSGFICELVAAINSSDDSITTVALTNLIFIDKLENRYQIAPIERDFIISSVNDNSTAGDIKINKFTLHQNYPNPFNPNTTIKFQIDQPGRTSLIIYNLLGQQVRKLLDKNLLPGEYRLHWDGKNDAGQILSSGVYFAKLASGGKSELIKLVLVR
ncbi:MAG: NosD domain-containing protein, partial [bacterium]|nr:NosD domain-containing protein [bacterium]